jgi:hypothetical protein
MKGFGFDMAGGQVCRVWCVDAEHATGSPDGVVCESWEWFSDVGDPSFDLTR